METLLRRSGWLTLAAVFLASLASGQSRGKSEEESAIKALVESENRVLIQGVGNLADVFAADADWTNAWGRRLHGREELSQFWEHARQSNFQVIPTRRIHEQIVVSKEDGKWLIQSVLIMDEKQLCN